MTDRRPTLTDREAIRRLAEIVARVADCIPAELARADALALERDLSEPAAPTGVEEWNRGQGQATLNGPPAAPTVTREQAEWVSDVIQTKWYDMRAKQDDEREAPPVRYEMPAFFRAVADALEEE